MLLNATRRGWTALGRRGELPHLTVLAAWSHGVTDQGKYAHNLVLPGIGRNFARGRPVGCGASDTRSGKAG